MKTESIYLPYTKFSKNNIQGFRNVAHETKRLRRIGYSKYQTASFKNSGLHEINCDDCNREY